MPRPPTPQAIRKLLASAGGKIDSRLPPGWRSSVEARTTDGGVVRFTAPDGRKADVRALAVDDSIPDLPMRWNRPKSRRLSSPTGSAHARGRSSPKRD